jgi:chromate transporter
LGKYTDWISVALTAAATLAIFRFKAGVIPVILACGALGMAIRLLA